MCSISSSAASVNTSKPNTPTIYIITFKATTSTCITSRSASRYARITITTPHIIAIISKTCISTAAITPITYCTIIAIIITSQAPSTACTASSAATIATTSTATIATSTIRRTFKMIIKKYPKNNFLGSII